MAHHSRTVLVALNDKRPPTDVRLFAKGANKTAKGTFIFDAEAARLTMSAFEAAGVDLAIDLEHQSIDADSRSRPDAADARGWCKLELRNGELWATDIKFTADGLARLANKTQRYFSPCFYTDQAGRVVEVLNIGLVAQPATYGATPLVAASRRKVVVSARVPRQVAAQLDRACKRRGITRSKFLSELARDFATAPVGSLAKAAKALGLGDATPAQIGEAVVSTLLARAADQEDKQIAAVAKALGLPKEAEPEEFAEAADELFASAAAGDVSLGGLAQALELEPDAPPEEVEAALGRLLAAMREHPEGDPLADAPQPPPSTPSLALSRSRSSSAEVAALSANIDALTAEVAELRRPSLLTPELRLAAQRQGLTEEEMLDRIDNAVVRHGPRKGPSMRDVLTERAKLSREEIELARNAGITPEKLARNKAVEAFEAKRAAAKGRGK